MSAHARLLRSGRDVPLGGPPAKREGVPMSFARKLALVIGIASSAAVWPAPQAVLTPPEHRRGAEQTYLTFPEWFLVHSPAEYAAYLHRDRCGAPPSGFPYFGHIGQFWQGYAAVSGKAAETGEVNFGYHVMVLVIGTSTTVEYALKAAYENTAGRLAELARAEPVAEDCVAAEVAQDYVDFIRVQPWYEYDFVKALGKLWHVPAPAGPQPWGDVLRRWERRWFLSTEYGVKAIYGWLIKKATKAAYDEPLPVTAIVTDRDPGPAVSGAPDYKRLSSVAKDARTLVTVPRYEAFMPHAQALAAQGLNFVEIAGNRGRILVSLWAKVDDKVPGLSDVALDLKAQVLFEQPILTLPGTRRIALTVPVVRLAEALRQWQKAGVKLEHVYDY